jgi:hypothetical protein
VLADIAIIATVPTVIVTTASTNAMLVTYEILTRS